MFSVGPASQFLLQKLCTQTQACLRCLFVWCGCYVPIGLICSLIARSSEMSDSKAGLGGDGVVMSIPEAIET